MLSNGLMNNSNQLPSTFLKRADKFISPISSSSNHIARIIRGLDPNKAHGHDMICIRMLKIYGEYILKPLDIIPNLASKKVSFLMNGKKQMWF